MESIGAGKGGGTGITAVASQVSISDTRDPSPLPDVKEVCVLGHGVGALAVVQRLYAHDTTVWVLVTGSELELGASESKR